MRLGLVAVIPPLARLPGGWAGTRRAHCVARCRDRPWRTKPSNATRAPRTRPCRRCIVPARAMERVLIGSSAQHCRAVCSAEILTPARWGGGPLE